MNPAVATALLVWGPALGAALLVIVMSHPYPGVTVDSAEYLAVAHSLTEGHGLTMPYISYDEAFRVLEPGDRVDMTQFPPLYPAVLAVVQAMLGVTSLDAVRIVGAGTYAGLVALVAGVIRAHTGRTLVAVLAAALLLAPDLLTLHAMAWSETIMLVAVAAALCFGWVYFRDRSGAALVLAGFFGAIASMARFAGVAVLVTIALALALDPRQTTTRLRRALLFMAVTLLPTIAWFVRNMLVAGYASEKTLRWHPPGLDHLAQATQAIGSWFVPGKAVALALAAGALVAGVVVLWRRRDRLPGISTLPGLALSFAGVYLLFMLATKTLLDQNISLDGRILAPLHVGLLIGLCTLATRPFGSCLVQVALVLLALLTVGRAVHAAATFSSSGTASYTNERWRSSEALAFTGTLPRTAFIITNAPDPIWLWHRHNPQILPPVVDLYTGLPNAEHDQQVVELKEAAACRHSRVVFFSQPTRKPPREIPGTLVHELDLRVERTMDDGAVYVMDDLPAC